MRAVNCLAGVSGSALLFSSFHGVGPTAPVAALFKKHLASEEFRGAFEHVVFAILDPLGTGNLGPFKQEFGGK